MQNQLQITLIKLGGAMVALGILFGAFGAHALKASLTVEMLDVYHTANFYHLLHAFGFILLGLVPKSTLSDKNRSYLTALMLGSILLFSGSLYALAITGQKWLGAITPIGGLGLILSWVLFALMVSSSKEENENSKPMV